MRTYLVVVDDSDESRLAQRFAARRASRTGGGVHLVVVVEPQDFVAWGGVQATIEEEARQRAEGIAQAAASAIHQEYDVQPSVTVEHGSAVEILRRVLVEDDSIAALVLGAAASGPPGPLVAHFTGNDAGALPVPVMIVPGSLSDAELDRLS